MRLFNKIWEEIENLKFYIRYMKERDYDRDCDVIEISEDVKDAVEEVKFVEGRQTGMEIAFDNLVEHLGLEYNDDGIFSKKTPKGKKK